MKSGEEISITGFDNKKYKSEMPDNLSINHQKAILTHYLHNIENGISKHFKEDAEIVMERFIAYNQNAFQATIAAEDAIQHLLFEVENVPLPPPKKYKFKFIDLFAGIGGFRIALQNLGGKCVFTSEWDKEAQKTYRANFGEVPFGDITKEWKKR